MVSTFPIGLTVCWLISTLFTLRVCSQEISLDLEIEAEKSIYFWEPLEVRVQLINQNAKQQTILAPPQGRVFIRKQGEQDWRRVGANIPQGFPMYRGQFKSVLDPGDTLVTFLLVRPLQYYSTGQEKEYNFEPEETYEIKYAYRTDSQDKEFSYQAVSTFSTLGKPDDQGFLLLDEIEQPFFLFEPSYGLPGDEKNIAACKKIIALDSPTLRRWAELYLYMQEYRIFAKKSRDRTIPLEERRKLYDIAKEKHFEFKAAYDSPYIQEVLKQRFLYAWIT